jgi:hypothetical protein
MTTKLRLGLYIPHGEEFSMLLSFHKPPIHKAKNQLYFPKDSVPEMPESSLVTSDDGNEAKMMSLQGKKTISYPAPLRKDKTRVPYEKQYSGSGSTPRFVTIKNRLFIMGTIYLDSKKQK